MVQKKAIFSEDSDGFFWSGFSYTQPFSTLMESGYQIHQVVNSDYRKEAIKSGGELFNLEALIQGGLIKKYKKSFYTYDGSFSIPGCQQLTRVVMSEPIYISPTSYEKVQKVMRQSMEVSNARNIQNVGTEGEEYKTQIQEYKIRYHVDTS